MILGIDEVGRGPWAGPLVVGAVVLGDAVIDGLNDSKKLTARRRELLAAEIYQHAAAVALGWVSARELDSIGMSAALVLATKRAVAAIQVPYHQIIIDGTINFLAGTTKGAYVTTMPKADGLVPAVSAASIVAKVARDAYMRELMHALPEFGFEKHAGYGTALHRQAIEDHGVTIEHRLSFKPLHGQTVRQKRGATAHADGAAAEQLVATAYEADGWSVIARNWRTKWSEIDLIVKRAGTVRCLEVKYSRVADSAKPLERVSPSYCETRLKAARAYAAMHGLSHVEMFVVPVSGEPAQLGTPLLLGQSPFN